MTNNVMYFGLNTNNEISEVSPKGQNTLHD